MARAKIDTTDKNIVFLLKYFMRYYDSPFAVKRDRDCLNSREKLKKLIKTVF
jgi:hypothetical protein